MPLRAFLALSRLAGETWLSSGQTIAHRSRMLAQAAGDPVALGHPEFSRMGSEKIAAGIEAAVALAMALPALQYRWATWWLDQGFRTPAAMIFAHQSFAREAIEMATAALRPVHRTASGNARRCTAGRPSHPLVRAAAGCDIS
jgi:hypothetical protein